MSDIKYGRYATFLEAVYKDVDLMCAFRKECEAQGIPIIKKDTAILLFNLLNVKAPHRLLEIGSAAGYSSIFMANAFPSVDITTYENSKKRADICKENIIRFKMQDRITLIEEDAFLALKDEEEKYPFIFLDAAKGQYINMLKDIKRILSLGGILVSDNLFFGGDTLESRYFVKRRDRTIHARLREYIRAITTDDELISQILPVGDGVSVSYKRDKNG